MSTNQNLLIERLPRSERARLLAICEPAQLVLGEVLTEIGARTEYVYFPIDGFISLVAVVDGHPGLEVGMVGREGMVGLPVVLGVDTSPVRLLVQGGGSCWRVGVPAFSRELLVNAPLQRQLDAYVHVVMAQLAVASVCLRFHLIGPRLARWLLMSQDRAHNSHFHVTHEFLAYMLGVRRVGVTVAAGELQRQGLISYHRGELTVLDRSGLEAMACSCYASDRHVYAQTLA